MQPAISWPRRIVAACFALLSYILNVIQLPSLPDDLAKWGEWMPVLLKHLVYYGPLYIAVAILLWPFLMQVWRWLWPVARPRKIDEVPDGSTAEALSQDLAGNDLVAVARSRIRVLEPPPPDTVRVFRPGVWIDDHPFDLIGRVKGLTQVQAQKMSNLFKNKWSALEGIVLDVSQDPGDRQPIRVSLDTHEEYRVFLDFDWWNDVHLLHLAGGKKLRFVGRIQFFDAKSIYYDECSPIVPPHPKS